MPEPERIPDVIVQEHFVFNWMSQPIRIQLTRGLRNARPLLQIAIAMARTRQRRRGRDALWSSVLGAGLTCPLR